MEHESSFWRQVYGHVVSAASRFLVLRLRFRSQDLSQEVGSEPEESMNPSGPS